MKTYTVHAADDRAPILVREGFSWGAFVFGPVWLAAHRAWIPAVLVLCAAVAVALAVPGLIGWLCGLGLAWLTGLFGHDARRWALARRGFGLAHVVASPDADAAYARLLEHHPALLERPR